MEDFERKELKRRIALYESAESQCSIKINSNKRAYSNLNEFLTQFRGGHMYNEKNIKRILDLAKSITEEEIIQARVEFQNNIKEI